MPISDFQRLVSNTSSVFLGSDRAQAAFNAANNTGTKADPAGPVGVWPSLQKFDNDTVFLGASPYGNVPNPEYVWDQPTSEGQTAAFAIASATFGSSANVGRSFSVSVVAFADNAMEAKLELYEQIGGVFVKAAPQPSGLDELLLVAGNPNTPNFGLVETEPFNWQNIRVYSTRFDIPLAPPEPPGAVRVFKLILSFEVTNYFQNPGLSNPAGLQFMLDLYSNIED